MGDWDDYRFFLAVARQSSISKAADSLEVNRSTVLRRLTAFEEKLGVRLFERTPSGYFTTPAGEEIMPSAIDMEEIANGISRRVAGQDQKLSGTIQVALAGALAGYVLMPALYEFAENNPDIRLEILNSYDMLDLAKREADVAIRISNDPPDNLVGRRVLKVAKAAYMAKKYATSSKGHPEYWVGWSLEPSSVHWIENSPFPDVPIGAVITDPFATVEAIKAGMGMTILPCFMGDQHPEICRVTKPGIIDQSDLWILTHKDLRKTARIRKFTEFITTALLKQRDLFEGRCAQSGL